MNSPGTKVVVVVLAVIVLLFAVTVGLQLQPRSDDPGDPSDSRLQGVRDALAGTRALQPDDIAGADCFNLAQSAFVVSAGNTCQVAMPSRVKQVKLCIPTTAGQFARITLDGDQFSPQIAEKAPPTCPEPVRFDVYDDNNVLELACVLGGDPCTLVFPPDG